MATFGRGEPTGVSRPGAPLCFSWALRMPRPYDSRAGRQAPQRTAIVSPTATVVLRVAVVKDEPSTLTFQVFEPLLALPFRE
ncbi:hypothetical protein GCM10019016_010530 [Streptomyces prasinosporus]|uniref:Uncharacterized protein n=1 Tax=Streptomyces prasinosporus TaxID=68256 RepID=A0ABP6TH92_9ACTN|nr:hypothetical protein GCM10010332_72110 [Streptomyces albogriseolus]